MMNLSSLSFMAFLDSVYNNLLLRISSLPVRFNFKIYGLRTNRRFLRIYDGKDNIAELVFVISQRTT